MRKLIAVACLASTAVLAGQGQQASIDWPFWGADQHQTKYSAATQITRANVNNLEVAWRWENDEKPIPEFEMRPGGLQSTPIMIDGLVYISTSYHRVVALDAETGKQVWAFDPKTYEEGPPIAGTGPHRGVMFWRDGDDTRILINARNKLFAVNAKTGQPIKEFGGGGNVRIDADHSREIPRGQFQSTSPGMIYKDLVIVGSRIPDRLQYRGDPPGSIQAFNIRTGKREWIFYTIPQSAKDFGADTWANESWKTVGHANVWTGMAIDEQRGLVYAPTSTMSGDYWGGQRAGANLFAETLLCLDARTGKRVWHFQAIHHGIWDWDFATPPNLLTITVDGKRIDAVAQLSKQGFAYVFDRVTGRPIWPIEERPVDTKSEIPGEQPYPTQPFPTKPAPLGPQGISLDDANDLTPEIKRLALEQMKRYTLGPIFTPPTFKGLLQRPSNNGVTNWGGAAVDPETGILYTRTSDWYYISEICKNDNSDPFVDVAYGNFCGSTGLFSLPPNLRPAGAPAVAPRPARPQGSPELFEPSAEQLARGGGSMRETGVVNPLGPIPLIKPPYAHLLALDMNRGEVWWKSVFGEGSPAMRRHPLLKGVDLPDRLGTPGNSGVAVTKGGLVFIGGGEPYLYAFDKMTGREIWRGSTDGRTGGNPISYQTRSGKQFVAITTSAGARSGAGVVAFALKQGGTSSAAASPAPAAAAPAARSASAPRAAATMTGEQAYRSVCAGCHGRTGGGGLGPAIAGTAHEASELIALVRGGRGQMPPTSERDLNDADIELIGEYLRTLGGR
jgi:quinoprotein glucose dehydrogenase